MPRPSPVRSLSVAGNLLAAGLANGEIRMFALGDAAITPTDQVANVGRAVRSVVLQPHGILLAAVTSDDTLKLYDVRTMREMRLPKMDGRGVAAAAFSGDGRILAVTTSDPEGTLLWEAAGDTWKRTGSLRNCARPDVHSLALSADGSTLACGKYSGEIVLADVGSRNAALLAKHTATVNSLSFDSHGEFLASGGADGRVYLWNVKRPGAQPRVLPGHTPWVWAVAFAPGGDRVATAGENGSVILWSARSAELARRLCQLLGSNELTEDEWKEHLPGVKYERGSPCVAGRR